MYAIQARLRVLADILEQSVSVRVVPELIVGEAEAAVTVLHTGVYAMF